MTCSWNRNCAGQSQMTGTKTHRSPLHARYTAILPDFFCQNAPHTLKRHISLEVWARKYRESCQKIFLWSCRHEKSRRLSRSVSPSFGLRVVCRMTASAWRQQQEQHETTSTGQRISTSLSSCCSATQTNQANIGQHGTNFGMQIIRVVQWPHGLLCVQKNVCTTHHFFSWEHSDNNRPPSFRSWNHVFPEVRVQIFTIRRHCLAVNTDVPVLNTDSSCRLV